MCVAGYHQYPLWLVMQAIILSVMCDAGYHQYPLCGMQAIINIRYV